MNPTFHQSYISLIEFDFIITVNHTFLGVHFSNKIYSYIHIQLFTNVHIKVFTHENFQNKTILANITHIWLFTPMYP